MTTRIIAFKGSFGRFDTYTCSVSTQDLPAMFAAYYEGIEHESDPQLRAQRALDMLHVKRIVNYLDRSVRAFGSPIATARVVSVTPLPAAPGLVEVELDDLYLVDGQKRVKACIIRAMDEPEWNDTIPLHIVAATTLRDKQQLFSSINSTAAKVSPSLNAIYDHANPLSAFIPQNFPAEVLECEKSVVSKSSNKLVTPAILKEAMCILLGTSQKQLASLPLEKMEASWDKWHPYMNELWAVYEAMSKATGGLPAMRDLSILPHNVGFLAIVRLFPLMDSPADLWRLVDLEPDGLTYRASGLWDGRCVMLGAIKKSGESVVMTAALLGIQLKLELDDNLKLYL
ncbi:DNA sulfur modification protein DndB [Aeromonas caviae]|uniref:DNA sulfur modification protein DndB n=1 Tax=Aeromonas caviae TaxID=648 RepID=UPI002448E3D2|nr:DNA sulfur modification protein DndB [Aeromonas caviae]MDH0477464.1 DNA sulfur modification protein DndB [Aeromonas caviae]